MKKVHSKSQSDFRRHIISTESVAMQGETNTTRLQMEVSRDAEMGTDGDERRRRWVEFFDREKYRQYVMLMRSRHFSETLELLRKWYRDCDPFRPPVELPVPTLQLTASTECEDAERSQSGKSSNSQISALSGISYTTNGSTGSSFVSVKSENKKKTRPVAVALGLVLLLLLLSIVVGVVLHLHLDKDIFRSKSQNTNNLNSNDSISTPMTPLPDVTSSHAMVPPASHSLSHTTDMSSKPPSSQQSPSVSAEVGLPGHASSEIHDNTTTSNTNSLASNGTEQLFERTSRLVNATDSTSVTYSRTTQSTTTTYFNELSSTPAVNITVGAYLHKSQSNATGGASSGIVSESQGRSDGRGYARGASAAGPALPVADHSPRAFLKLTSPFVTALASSATQTTSRLNRQSSTYSQTPSSISLTPSSSSRITSSSSQIPSSPSKISSSSSQIASSSSQIPSSSSQMPLLSDKIPYSSSQIPSSSAEIPSSLSQIPSSSSKISSSASKISSSSSQIPSPSSQIHPLSDNIPFSSSQIPSSSAEIPSSSSRIPSSSSKISSSSSKIFSSSSQIPLSSSQIPLSSSQIPLSSSQIPLSSSQIPSLSDKIYSSSQISSLSPQIPSSTSHIPAASSQIPSSTSHTPSASSQIPSSTSHTPSASSQIPSSTSHTPSASSQIPSSTSHTPSASSQIPFSTSHTPSASSQIPFSTSHTPSASSQIPFSLSQIPSPSSKIPSSSSFIPSSSSVMPSSSSQIQSATFEIPSTSSQMTLPTSQMPSSSSQIPFLSSQIPSSPSQIPSSSSQIPFLSSQIPSSSSQIPSSSSQTQSSSSQKPSLSTKITSSLSYISSSPAKIPSSLSPASFSSTNIKKTLAPQAVTSTSSSHPPPSGINISTSESPISFPTFTNLFEHLQVSLTSSTHKYSESVDVNPASPHHNASSETSLGLDPALSDTGSVMNEIFNPAGAVNTFQTLTDSISSNPAQRQNTQPLESSSMNDPNTANIENLSHADQANMTTESTSRFEQLTRGRFQPSDVTTWQIGSTASQRRDWPATTSGKGEDFGNSFLSLSQTSEEPTFSETTSGESSISFPGSSNIEHSAKNDTSTVGLEKHLLSETTVKFDFSSFSEARNKSFWTGGDFSARPGGDFSARPGGDFSARPGGDFSARPGGDFSARPGGDFSARPGGDISARPGGDISARSRGDFSARPGGDFSARPGGDSSARSGGDFSARSGGDSSARSGGDFSARSDQGSLTELKAAQNLPSSASSHQTTQADLSRNSGHFPRGKNSQGSVILQPTRSSVTALLKLQPLTDRGSRSGTSQMPGLTVKTTTTRFVPRRVSPSSRSPFQTKRKLITTTTTTTMMPVTINKERELEQLNAVYGNSNSPDGLSFGGSNSGPPGEVVGNTMTDYDSVIRDMPAPEVLPFAIASKVAVTPPVLTTRPPPRTQKPPKIVLITHDIVAEIGMTISGNLKVGCTAKEAWGWTYMAISRYEGENSFTLEFLGGIERRDEWPFIPIDSRMSDFTLHRDDEMVNLVLETKYAMCEDKGRYICEVNVNKTFFSKTFNVDIKKKPDKPVLTFPDEVFAGDDVTIVTTWDAGNPLIGHIVHDVVEGFTGLLFAAKNERTISWYKECAIMVENRYSVTPDLSWNGTQIIARIAPETGASLVEKSIVERVKADRKTLVVLDRRMCDNKMGQRLPNPYNAHKYISCSVAGPKVDHCPEGHAFNVTKKICVLIPSKKEGGSV